MMLVRKMLCLQCVHPTWALKQVDIEFINSMLILTMWKMCNYRVWQAKAGTKVHNKKNELGINGM